MGTRRSFFEEVALLSAMAAVLQEEGHAQAKDEKLSNFWDAYFNEATRDPAVLSRGATDNELIDPAKKVQLIHAGPDGLRYPDTIADSELKPDSDVVVTVNPGHFRPGPEDHKAIARSKGCQVRLDWVQTRPIMNLIAPMAWAGLAAWSVEKQTESPIKDVNNKVIGTKTSAGPATPSLKDLDFRDPNDPNAPVQNQVILMGGSGRMALNVRAVRVNRRLQSVLDKSVSYASIISPFFGFAPIAIPALRIFTELLGAVFNHEAVIMNSLPVQVLATRDSRKGPHNSNSMKIVGGDFIAVPNNQTPDLKADMEKLRVVNGWLVHQDSDKNLPVEARAADKRVPPVSYMSMNLTIEALPDVVKRKAQGG